jgi:Glycosyl hydrolase family 26
MLTLVAVLLASLSTSCAGDPAGPAKALAPDPAPEPAAPSASAAPRAPAAAAAPAAPRANPAAARYKYGVKFEPPDGKVLHGMGQWAAGNKNYIATLADPEIEPAMMLFFVNIGDWPRPWDSRLETLKTMLLAEVAQGRILHVSIAFRGLDPQAMTELPVDREVAESTRYDDRIRDLALAIQEVGAPTFVRIGFEFSGDWNGYTPYVYPKAFQHTVDIFREAKVENVAFVWCFEGSCPPDFDEKNKDGWRWYPGDEYVDWFGVDLFGQQDFSGGAGRSGKTSRYDNVLKFLAMAEAHKRPVMIGESGAVKVGITPDEKDGKRDWDTWFEPFFKFMADNPGIKAFHYCNSEWKNNRTAAKNGWLDGDISHNDWIAKQYIKALRDPMFLHKPDLPELRDWKPLPKVAPPPPPAPGGGR